MKVSKIVSKDKTVYSSFTDVVKNNICSGCGVCSFLKPENISIKKNKHGQLIPIIIKPLNKKDSDLLGSVCPFSSSSLDRSAESEFSSSKNYVGDYLKAYAGHVVESSFRENGSSGGFGSWILNELITHRIVDAVIHVKKSNGCDSLFEYSISNTSEDINSGASSKYYPVSLNNILELIKNTQMSYALIAIPCFVRAIKNLQSIDPEVSQKIKIIGSLYCGHLKTENYTHYIADDIKFNHGKLKSINFRVKAENEKSSNYMTEITTSEGTFKKFRQSIKGTNWGLGLFKYKSCDYCEDVSGELADFSLGDAWLPKYEGDDLGTNLIVVRSPIILDIITKAGERLAIEEVTNKDLFDSQAGGYRHKREGIHVRNSLLKFSSGFVVRPRFKLQNDVKFGRKVIYFYRVFLRNYSRLYFYARKSELTFKAYNFGITLLAKIHGLLIKVGK